jgi:hypothetical protein
MTGTFDSVRRFFYKRAVTAYIPVPGPNMHGQKKRRKRTIDGSIEIDGTTLRWWLLSEPQWSTEHRYKGLCIAVRREDGSHRELILEYAYPTNNSGSPLPLPQRPRFSAKTIEADVRQAIAAGWSPISRGKTFIYHVPEISN